MNRILPFCLLLLSILFFRCNEQQTATDTAAKMEEKMDTLQIKQQIADMLDSFNLAAANASYEHYFSFFTPDAVFLGTDATEHWTRDSFKVWAKPWFDKGKAWSFHTVDRYVYTGKYADMAWFDELLDAGKARIYRGSGVVVKSGGQWKIQQYVLSMTMPNAVSKAATEVKSMIEDSLLIQLKHKDKVNN